MYCYLYKRIENPPTPHKSRGYHHLSVSPGSATVAARETLVQFLITSSYYSKNTKGEN